MKVSKSIVITGIYSSGKTTLAAHLRALPGYVLYPEVGGEIRKRSKCRSFESCSIFDELVMLREIERDNAISQDLKEDQVAIFEQWHIGNIAYMSIRSPEYVGEYLNRISDARSIELFQPIVIFLDLDPALISTRISYTEEQERQADFLFYTRWRHAIYRTMESLNVSSMVIDASKSPAAIASEVLSQL